MSTSFELVELEADRELRTRSVADPLGPAVQDQGRAMVWRFTESRQAVSSASVGGGWGRIDWVTNIGVTMDYRRTDLGAHAAAVAQQLGLSGTGCALFTAADISKHQTATDDGVRCDVTVGISKPTWAADADDMSTPWAPGTINTVIQLPVALAPAAAVNAVITATEAKTQALVEAGTPGTGTASDAVVICWKTDASPESFAGPRSRWGARLARATHASITAALAAKAHAE